MLPAGPNRRRRLGGESKFAEQRREVSRSADRGEYPGAERLGSEHWLAIGDRQLEGCKRGGGIAEAQFHMRSGASTLITTWRSSVASSATSTRDIPPPCNSCCSR
jgi:hypothetical protein